MLVFIKAFLTNSTARIIGFDMETCPAGISSLLASLKCKKYLQFKTLGTFYFLDKQQKSS